MLLKRYVLSIVLFLCLVIQVLTDDEEDPEKTTDPSKRQPSKCEVCKYLVRELRMRLDETGKTRGTIDTGYNIDQKKKKSVKYEASELRLIEALQEPHICDRILEYNVHAERKGSLRYEKGMSETMQTLHGLVNKGVKVDLGMPYELWDKPSAEVTIMQRNCFQMVEDFEEDIEDWYYSHQDVDLTKYICIDRVLKNKDQSCLSEVYEPSDNKTGEEEEPKKKKSKKKKTHLKGDKGKEDTSRTEL